MTAARCAAATNRSIRQPVQPALALVAFLPPLRRPLQPGAWLASGRGGGGGGFWCCAPRRGVRAGGKGTRHRKDLFPLSPPPQQKSCRAPPPRPPPPPPGGTRGEKGPPPLRGHEISRART